MNYKDYLENIINNIKLPDEHIKKAAEKRQAELAKPPGSLGRLEEYACEIAAIQHCEHPTAEKPCVLVFAADNGVIAEGVSSAPQSVTLSQSINMTRKITGMSSMAGYFNDGIIVTDVGINSKTVGGDVRDRKIRRGTNNIKTAPAMTIDEFYRAAAVGIETVKEAHDAGYDIVGIGEMGICNTTTSTAVLCALTGLDCREITGRGGGLIDEAYENKKNVIASALALHKNDICDVPHTVSALGGFDIAAMCGAFIGCAYYNIPAVVDGFISIVAALCAAKMVPAVRAYLFLSHISEEPGYLKAAEIIGKKPCLDLNMRLGEGSGCVIMFRVLQAACASHNLMGTFEEAEINDDYLEEIRADEKSYSRGQ